MEKKIKLLFVYSSKGFGGIVQNLSLLTKNLHKDRFDVFVISLANAGDAASDLMLGDDSGVVFCRIDERHVLDLDALRQIDRFIKSHGIDVVSCHGCKADVYGIILRVFFKNAFRLLTMVHGWTKSGFKVELYVLLDMFVMRFFDKIILVSNGQRDRLRRYLVPDDKMTVINNAVDAVASKEPIDKSAVRQEFGINANDAVIGLIGRLSGEKDVGTAIAAFVHVLDSRKDAMLLVVGDGPERSALMRLARKLSVDDRVVFTGYQKDMARIYGIIDVYISTSIGEGLPNALLEAQASGTPCVVTDVSGNRDVVTDGINGYLIKTGDPKALAGKVLALLGPGSLGSAFGDASRQTIKDRFSIAHRVNALEALYSRVCENRT